MQNLTVILFLVLVSSENTLAMKGRIIYEGIINFSDSIELKKQQSIHPISKSEESTSKKTEKFLLKSADARMMDAAEGKLASEKGTTDQIRKYGELMITDQSKLLTQLKKIAEAKDIMLPDKISNKKEYFLQKLSEKDGTDFDKKSIRMITIDHKRDIRMFKRAVKSEDTDISAFAKQYLPLIQSHLDQIDRISDKSER